MSEITKLYENVGIKKVRQTNIAGGDYPIAVGFEDYPQFTAEKQLKILCLIVNSKHSVTFCNPLSKGDELTLEKIQESLAWAINRIWQDLTEDEKTSIKNILEM